MSHAKEDKNALDGHSVAMRAAILDVIDAGWKTKAGDKACYLFWDDESDEQTEMRTRFVDHVLEKLKG